MDLHPLRQWRRSNSVTLDELERRSGVGATHLSMLERGKRGVSLKSAINLSRETGLPVESFLQEAC